MSLRSILVQVDASDRARERVDTAIRLAKAFECRLVGLSPTGRLESPQLQEPLLAESASAAWEDRLMQARANAQHFSSQCEGAGLRGFEAYVEEADQVTAIVQQARLHDLTVLSQPDPDEPSRLGTRRIVELTALQSGRPALALPYARSTPSLGTRVLVAWKDSREAARSLQDALPLLRRADEVHVITWVTGQDEATLEHRGLEGVRRWLGLHGVQATIAVESTTIPIGETLLSRAADLETDLIVMGAYGHSRFSERVLGGVTRTLLASMTVPVLMSY